MCASGEICVQAEGSIAEDAYQRVQAEGMRAY